MKKKIDIEKVEGALKRAARAAESGSIAERAGRVLAGPKRIAGSDLSQSKKPPKVSTTKK